MANIEKIDRTTDVVILLFYYAGTIEGVTKVQKLLYLIQKETDFYREYKNDVKVDFKPYKMGPFSEEVYDELEFLLNIKAIEKEEIGRISAETYEPTAYSPDEGSQGLSGHKFIITEKGKDIGRDLEEILEPRYQEELEELVARYNIMPLRSLLRYVYEEYPDSAENSEIKEELFH